jgi:hypothetical protein
MSVLPDVKVKPFPLLWNVPVIVPEPLETPPLGDKLPAIVRLPLLLLTNPPERLSEKVKPPLTVTLPPLKEKHEPENPRGHASEVRVPVSNMIVPVAGVTVPFMSTLARLIVASKLVAKVPVSVPGSSPVKLMLFAKAAVGSARIANKTTRLIVAPPYVPVYPGFPERSGDLNGPLRRGRSPTVTLAD